MLNIPPLKLGLGFSSMFELNAAKFFDTTGEIRRLKTVIETNFDEQRKAEAIDKDLSANLANSFDEMGQAAQAIGAELSMISAYRIRDALLNDEITVKISDARDAMHDIESRLRDELYRAKRLSTPGTTPS